MIDSFGLRSVYEKISGNVCIEVEMQHCDEVRLKLSTMTAPTCCGNGQTAPRSGPLLQGRGILGAIHLLSPDPEQQGQLPKHQPQRQICSWTPDTTTIFTCGANTRIFKTTSGGDLTFSQIVRSGSWPSCIGLGSRAHAESSIC